MLATLLVFGVVLLIICLIARDQTEYRLSRLRSEFMFLRSEEKRLAERRDEVELMVSQIDDGLLRAERRHVAIEQSADAMGDLLEKLQEGVEAEGLGEEEAADEVAADGVAADDEAADVEAIDPEGTDTEPLT